MRLHVPLSLPTLLIAATLHSVATTRISLAARLLGVSATPRSVLCPSRGTLSPLLSMCRRPAAAFDCRLRPSPSAAPTAAPPPQPSQLLASNSVTPIPAPHLQSRSFRCASLPRGRLAHCRLCSLLLPPALQVVNRSAEGNGHRRSAFYGYSPLRATTVFRRPTLHLLSQPPRVAGRTNTATYPLVAVPPTVQPVSYTDAPILLGSTVLVPPAVTTLGSALGRRSE